MAYTYADQKKGLDEIAERIRSNRNRLEQATATVTTAAGDLGGMVAAYTPMIDSINTAVTAAPEDAALLVAQAEATLLVNEFLALLAKAQAVQAAIAAVG